MSTTILESTLSTAKAEGLLPQDLVIVVVESRPWPVVVLSALGAWLAVVPLLIFLILGFEDSLLQSSAAGFVAAILVACSVLILRTKSVPLFLEQLAFPGLLCGVGLITWMMVEYLNDAQVAAALLCIALLALSVMLPQTWLRALIGAATAASGGFALVSHFGWWIRRDSGLTPWATLHLLLAVVLAMAVCLLRQAPAGSKARVAALVESVGSGWLVATLAGLAWFSGMTFLGGALVGVPVVQELSDIELSHYASQISLGPSYVVSATLACLGGFWLVYRWTELRRAWCAGVLLVLIGLAGMMPALGGCLLTLALCISTRRWRLATAAAVAAVWIVGSFYYALSWPLATKAAALVMAAAVLAGLAVWGLSSQYAKVERPFAGAANTALRTSVRSVWGFVMSILLTLVTVNGSIWQKEQLIAHGQAVFVPLVPTDPRSLMQGDYMTLNFLPRLNASEPNLDMSQEAFEFEHPRMIFKRDALGILSAQGPDVGQALARDEVAIQLVPKNGRWILVTDAFYFKEGEATRWAAAQFGEFRIDAKGNALLVGLRGEGLKPL